MRAPLAALCITFAWLAACSAQPWVELGGERFNVEIARTVPERMRGLMFRESMPADHGMLFVYPDARPRAFWMKNTLIPLDIMFFDAGQRLINVQTAPPCRSDPCPSYTSDAPSRYILELNAGSVERLGVKPGDRLELHLSQGRSTR